MNINKIIKSSLLILCIAMFCGVFFSIVGINSKTSFSSSNKNFSNDSSCYMTDLDSNKEHSIICYNEDSVFVKINNYLENVVSKAHFPAMSLTIVNKDDVLFSNAYGNCDSTDTSFLLGSVSKSFTAVCIMQLVESSRLNLDDKLSTYLPSATDGNKITIRQLLNHTSGLGEHQNLSNYKIVGKQGLHHYANVNYSLLGKVIEKVSGVSYEDYVTENIFTRLDMLNSATTYEKSVENGLIDSYQNWFGFNVKSKPKYPSNDNSWITTSAGYLSSSTDDLGRYLQMYLNGGNGIISSESINKMFYENVQVDASIPYKYGMGWTLINEPLKEPALRHSGLVETGMSTIYILPEREIGIAICVNYNDYFVGKDLMDRIDWGVALMLMGEEPNEISANEYVLRHLLYDIIYLVVLVIAILPLCFITLYKKHILKGKMWLKFLFIFLLHLVLPIFILLLPIIFFATPLWVVCSFVPDMFTIIVLSSVLLFVGGITKLSLIILNKFKKA